MKMKFNNSEYVFSLYKNLLTTEKPEQDIDINQLYEIIRFGYLKSEINELRNTSKKSTEYVRIKKEVIPCVTLSGRFGYRSSNGFLNHSGLLQIDIDNVADYDSKFKSICNDPYTYICFRSPGGNGIKVIVKINNSKDTHLDQFYVLSKYYKDTFGIGIDKACKDIARCMLLSWDPEIYCNPFSEVYPEMYIKEEPEPVQLKKKINLLKTEFVSGDGYDITESIINSLERGKIDITAEYGDWIRVGHALCSTFGEVGRKYYHRISSLYIDYTYEETDKKYTQLLGRDTGKIGIGTLIWMAKEHGIELHKIQLTVRKQYNYTEEINQAAEDRVEYKTEKKEQCENNIPDKGKGNSKVLGVQDRETSINIEEKTLFCELRELRRKISREENISAFRVFYNNTLEELVQKKPQNIHDLYYIKGLGDRKIKWFGNDIIRIMNHFNKNL